MSNKNRHLALTLTMSALLPFGYQTTWGADSPSADSEKAPVRDQPQQENNRTFVESLNLETHGFASFGYLQTSRNNWLGQTRDGTGEFWEVAANVIARPIERVRLGVQLFARDLVYYDNGNVNVDWAYADYRFDDALGVQVGRFKLPLGLYNESLDVVAARAGVFLPTSVYPTQSRDFQISTDGAKVYGTTNLNFGGSLDYAAYLGGKQYDLDAGYATYVAQIIGLNRLSELTVNYLAGGMLHWETPLDGFSVRVSGAYLDGVVVKADTGIGSLNVDAEYYVGYFSLLYSLPRVTLASEYRLIYGRGDTTLAGVALDPLVDNTEGVYVSATWHAASWWEGYAAIEGAWADAQHRSNKYAYTGVLGLNLMPLRNWSIKAEVRGVRGVMGVLAADNPNGIDDRWGVLALKTTVDF